MTDDATDRVLRPPEDGDWRSIAVLADAAIAHVEGAPSQQGWVANRRTPDSEQVHCVALEGQTVVGYAAVERRSSEPEGAYRIFIVTSWPDCPDVADELYTFVQQELDRVGAEMAWLREFADDRLLIGFFRRHGFEVRERYDYEGQSLVTIAKKLR